MLSKNKRIKDQKAIDKARKENCEYCGQPGNNVHHILTKGSGAPDIAENLINLCFICHTRVHQGNIKRESLFEIVSIREFKHIDEFYIYNIMQGIDK